MPGEDASGRSSTATVDETAREHLPLHPLEFRILLVLLEGDYHGYRIVREIEEREPGVHTIYPANLYRRIRDLRDRGLLGETEGPEEKGRPRKYFGITALGRSVAAAEARRLEELVMAARTAELLDAAGSEGG